MSPNHTYQCLNLILLSGRYYNHPPPHFTGHETEAPTVRHSSYLPLTIQLCIPTHPFPPKVLQALTHPCGSHLTVWCCRLGTPSFRSKLPTPQCALGKALAISWDSSALASADKARPESKACQQQAGWRIKSLGPAWTTVRSRPLWVI